MSKVYTMWRSPLRGREQAGSYAVAGNGFEEDALVYCELQIKECLLVYDPVVWAGEADVYAVKP